MQKKIKSVEVRKYDYVIDEFDNEVREEEGVLHSFNEYDKNGSITTEKRYDIYGNLVDISRLKYDDSSRLVEECLLDENGDIMERRTFEWDKNGNLLRELQHYIDDSYDTTEIVYDKDGNITEKNKHDSDGEFDGKELSEYKDGKKIREEIFDENNQLIKKITYDYDDNGYLTERGNWDIEDDDYYKIVNKYDDKGNVIRVLKYNDSEQLIEKSVYSLDNEFRVVKIVEEDQFREVEVELEYDSKGNVIRQKEINSEGEMNHLIIRKFDENNNISESEVSINGHGQELDQHYLMTYNYEFYVD